MKTVTFRLTLAVFDVKQHCIGVWLQSIARAMREHKESLV